MSYRGTNHVPANKGSRNIAAGVVSSVERRLTGVTLAGGRFLTFGWGQKLEATTESCVGQQQKANHWFRWLKTRRVRDRRDDEAVWIPADRCQDPWYPNSTT